MSNPTKYRTSELRQELIELYQRTIDLEDPNRQYIGFLADKSIELVRKNDKRLPLTQQELANYLGVSRQTINAWVKNPEKMQLKYLSKIMSLEQQL